MVKRLWWTVTLIINIFSVLGLGLVHAEIIKKIVETGAIASIGVNFEELANVAMFLGAIGITLTVFGFIRDYYWEGH